MHPHDPRLLPGAPVIISSDQSPATVVCLEKRCRDDFLVRICRADDRYETVFASSLEIDWTLFRSHLRDIVENHRRIPAMQLPHLQAAFKWLGGLAGEPSGGIVPVRVATAFTPVSPTCPAKRTYRRMEMTKLFDAGDGSPRVWEDILANNAYLVPRDFPGAIRVTEILIAGARLPRVEGQKAGVALDGRVLPLRDLSGQVVLVYEDGQTVSTTPALLV